ncbi:MAG: ferredoxin [Candidatus Thermoplasmatota archaeon]|jgi:ferredoxin|nr:ferredoxin [Candidatus Thermoplasmatota archaeon]MCL5793907.1 ferredoxin [Candidatus Thermoplasmatota archaeon]
MRYTIRIDQDRCRGESICTAIVPDNFVMSASGKAEVNRNTIGEEEYAKHREASRLCPYYAIALQAQE